MSASDPINWDLGNAPKQSITEVLQNPRGSSLELPDLPSFDLTTPTPTPPPPPPNINEFEVYLRRYTPLLKAFHHEKQLLETPEHQAMSIPNHYYEPNFNVCQNPELTDVAHHLQPSETHQLRSKLASYKKTLETTLQSKLNEQKQPITEALTQIRTLRSQILETAAALRAARSQLETLLPSVTSGLCTARSLTALQKNARALRSALRDVRNVMAAPEDVTTLLNTAEYSAAIDAIDHAKESLNGKELSTVPALAPVRGRLAQSVEAIDSALREEFRMALHEDEPVEDALKQVVRLEGRIGRIPLLKAFFLKEVKIEVDAQVRSAGNLDMACRRVKEGAEKVLTLLRMVEMDDGRKEALEDLEEMLATAVDQFLGIGSENKFVVVKEIEDFAVENSFDEFKGAMRFAEEVRCAEKTAKELESLFEVERRGNALRAKVSERQIAFIGAFHRAHVDTLESTLRADKWQEVVIPRGVIHLMGAALNDGKQTEGAESADGLIAIDGSKFRTVTSGVRYVMSICAYVLLAEKAPNLAPEIARRATELTRLFNSMVGKAILGAAALQWSGLRSITARHLSLASRTIAMAAAVAERINVPLERALSDAQKVVIVPLIQKSEKDLRDHHGQLLAKILAIMMERLDAHESVLKSLPWDKSQEMQRFAMPSDYITTLVKEATVLHRILWSVLPRVEVSDIFQRVCTAYGSHLTESYGNLDGGKRWIRTRVAEDVSCLHERLKVLDVLQENPSAFKPISKLYDRFAREYVEGKANGAADAGAGRSFIVRKHAVPTKDQLNAGDSKNQSRRSYDGQGGSEQNGTRENPDSDRTEEDREPLKDMLLPEQQDDNLKPPQQTERTGEEGSDPDVQKPNLYSNDHLHTGKNAGNGSVSVPEGDLLNLGNDLGPTE